MDRPALQRLLQDITAGAIHVVLAYKVDRLSRSLLDFARIMEIFDKHQVAFVSITQQFHTATSSWTAAAGAPSAGGLAKGTSAADEPLPGTHSWAGWY
jgi:hypothetical protein